MRKLLISNNFAISASIAVSEQHTVNAISFSSANSTSSAGLDSLISTTVANSDIASFPGATKILKFSYRIFANAYSIAK